LFHTDVAVFHRAVTVGLRSLGAGHIHDTLACKVGWRSADPPLWMYERQMMADQPNNWLDDDQAAPGAERPRYVIAGEENGSWSVYDRLTNLPAILDEEMLVEMTFERADDMLELMNQIEADSKQKAQQGNPSTR
jgi:hypothetical protein